MGSDPLPGDRSGSCCRQRKNGLLARGAVGGWARLWRDHGGADGQRPLHQPARRVIFDSVRALTATIAAELGETAVGSDHYQALFTHRHLSFRHHVHNQFRPPMSDRPRRSAQATPPRPSGQACLLRIRKRGVNIQSDCAEPPQPQGRRPHPACFSCWMTCILLVVPVLALILGTLIVQRRTGHILGVSVLADPIDGMTAGGIFPALVGTVWLVVGCAADRLGPARRGGRPLSQRVRPGQLVYPVDQPGDHQSRRRSVDRACPLRGRGLRDLLRHRHQHLSG